MRRVVVLAAVFVAAFAVGIGRASAATFTAPPSSPIVVAVDAQRHPKPLTISVRGFVPGSLAYVAQCDGVSPSTPSWSASEHCDLGNSPAAAVVDASGSATFDASDRAHVFVPFAGESPQSLFNCVPFGDRAPNNGLPTFATCQVRVSSNATTVTSDQIFAPLQLPRGVRRAPASGSSTATSSTTTSSTPQNASAHAGSPAFAAPAGKRTRHANSASDASVSVALPTGDAHSPSRPGLLALSDPIIATGEMLLVAGFALVVGVVLRTRRRAAVRRA